ncbi:MAG: glycoside hydrolase family 20 zincin-like fold domain-containing protein, partial [Flavobacteriales bacterium]|nr:glycoside hydrolase family 20 zincin-like fold domain-containing protein [Flavobacteriales bacterium]
MKKIILSLLAIGCLWGCKTAEKLYPAPLEVTWRMEGNRMDADSTHYKTVWCFKNVSDAPLDNNWILYYNQFSRVPKYEENTPVKLEQVIAYFFRIFPTENYKTLEPGDSMVVTIYLRGSALKKTEGPMGMYFVPCDESGKELSPVKMKPVELSFVNTPKSLLRSKRDQYPFPTGQYLYSMDKDLVLTDSVAHTDIIPSVKEVLQKGKNITIPSSLQISAPDVLNNEKNILSSVLKEENNAKIAPNGSYTIELKLNQELTNQEAYSLTLDSTSAVISGATPAGVFYGIQTLRSMLNGASLPFTTQSITINDAPDMEYRGFMLDVARNFQSKEAIMRVLDVMAHFKLN